MKRALPKPELEAPRRLEWLPLAAIKPAGRNPKRHDVTTLGTSVARFGYVEPMVMDERTGRLVAGHGRREALMKMRAADEQPPEGVRVDAESGEWCAPVLRGWSSRSDTEAEAYLLASNRLVETGGWDDSQLAELLKGLADQDALDGVGFGEDDIARLLESAAGPYVPTPEDDEVPEPKDVYVKPGELWTLGRHRILAGDCRLSADVARLLGDTRINVCVTSPPYAAQREYDKSSGFVPIPSDEYVDWFEPVQANIAARLAPDGSFFLNIKEHCEDGQRSLYVKDLTLAHVRRWGWRFVDELCWVKPGFPGENKGRFKNGWEPVFHWTKAANHKHRPNAVGHQTDAAIEYEPERRQSMSGVGRRQDKPTLVVPGIARPTNVITATPGHTTADMAHSAAFPVALPEFFVRAFSDAGDSVFDPFLGSGTTLIAAEKNERQAFGMELSPAYVQVGIDRWEKLTGKKAERA